jgi:hypothetical protein
MEVKVNSGIGLSYRPASHVAWRAGVDFISQSGIHEFGYSKQNLQWFMAETAEDIGKKLRIKVEPCSKRKSSSSKNTKNMGEKKMWKTTLID